MNNDNKNIDENTTNININTSNREAGVFGSNNSSSNMNDSTATINSENRTSTSAAAAAKYQQKYYEIDKISNKKEMLALAHKLIKREKIWVNLTIQLKWRVEDPFLPQCIICSKVITNDSMKPSKLYHLQKIHPGLFGKPKEYFEEYHRKKCLIFIAQNFFLTHTNNRSGLQASYNILLMIAKQGHPHTKGQNLIRPSILKAYKVANVLNTASVLASIPLSNNTVSSRICEIAEDVESIVVEDLQHYRFSLTVGDSTFDNKCVVLAFACYVKDTTVCENLLFLKTILKNTGEMIYNAVMDYLTKNGIDPLNRISIWTDGAPSMIGKSQGFVARWIEFNPVFTIHCILH
ncbi:Hypothetical predicted protein [Octopus vulgaris]|uniref:DUF4371 domain-containing protein n=1 Tax=Octopus vulgaris TaxID=6645 RepID=A0AA36ASA7_OCTVU|nr:Hypothetical predicted protein [Octopus vulgaris]